LVGTGNDLTNWVAGTNGNNTLDGGAGTDTLEGKNGNDTYYVDVSTDHIGELPGEGFDQVYSTAATYTLSGYLETLTLLGTGDLNGSGNADNNTITGNAGHNSLFGNDGTDILHGGEGNDSLNGGEDNDTLYGGLGDDAYVVDSGSDVIGEGVDEGVDIVYSAASGYTLSANLENLTLIGTANRNGTGNALNNTIIGNEGANILNGGAGADTLLGGGGNDTYIIDADDTIEELYESTNGDADLVQADFSYTLLTSFENLTLTGTADINGTGNYWGNTIRGNSGNNTLDGAGGSGDVLIGGAGNDIYYVHYSPVGGVTVTESANQGIDEIRGDLNWSLDGIANVENLTLLNEVLVGTGNSLANVITGNAADNTLDGMGGADTLLGGAGNDTYLVDHASDVVTESADEGTDVIYASASHTLEANVEDLLLLGSANIHGTGNSLANTILGNGGNNSLDGGAGADTLTGGGGNDTYGVDDAGDEVTENTNEGTDLVRSSVDYALGDNLENLTLIGGVIGTGNELDNVLIGGDFVTNTLIGGGGNDTLDGAGGISDTLIGGTGNDVYLVVNGPQNFGVAIIENADEGIDEIRIGHENTNPLTANVENLTMLGGTTGIGNELDNVITGNSGANYLDGGIGADTLIGGAGNDTYGVDSSLDVVTEGNNAGTDTVYSSITYTLGTNLERLELQGTSNIDATGNTVGNVLVGNSGNNTLDGGAGADNMNGGFGDDTYIVDNASDVVTEDSGSGGIDHVISSVSRTLGANQDNLTLTGAAVIGTGNADVNVITGTAGNNTLNGAGGADTLVGGAGNDSYVVDNSADVIVEQLDEGFDVVSSSQSYVLSAHIENLTLSGTALAGTGNASNNTINGNASANTLDGGAGDDVLVGGNGNDTYYVDSSSDTVSEVSGAAGSGTDIVNASATFTLSANVEHLTLTGTANINGTGNNLNNSIAGNAGDNVLNGVTGVDTLVGGAGNDTFFVDGTNDVVSEGVDEGIDTLVSSVSRTLGANFENLTLTGSSNALTGTGNALDNVITANDAGSLLVGGAGNDTLIGGLEKDGMFGEQGDDVYYVNYVAEIIAEAANEGTDEIRSTITWDLWENFENLTLLGSANIDGLGNDYDNVLIGNAGSNSLTGLLGNDTLDGGADADTLIGGEGNDIYVVDNAGDVVVEVSGEGADEVRASVSYTLSADVEALTLLTGAVSGTGNAAANVITGNSGANTLDGGAGTDTLIGGTGDDTYIVDDAGDVVTEGSGAGTDEVWSGIDFTLGAHLENLILSGSALVGTGNGLDNVLTGTASANTLSGAGGADTLDGAAGADTLIGGDGNDTYAVDDVGDVVTEASGEGTDQVDALVSYALGSDVENLTLSGSGNTSGTGNILANTIAGNSGDNTLDGAGGADILTGGAGDDLFVYRTGDGADTVNDFVAGESTDDRIDLIDVAGIDDFADVLSAASQQGSDVLLDFGGGDTITLVGVNLATLHADDFVV